MIFWRYEAKGSRAGMAHFCEIRRYSMMCLMNLDHQKEKLAGKGVRQVHLQNDTCWRTI